MRRNVLLRHNSFAVKSPWKFSKYHRFQDRIGNSWIILFQKPYKDKQIEIGLSIN